MTKKPQIEAGKRKILGKKVRRLRREGLLPVNIYGKKVKSTAIQVNRVDFEKLLRKAGETDVIELKVKGEKEPRPVLIADVQRDPVTSRFLHADFMQVDLTEKVKVEIPIKFVGESEAVKAGNILLELMDEVEVEALPTNLPSEFEVDISRLKEIGDEIKVDELKVPSKVEVLTEADELIAKIEAPAVEREKVETPETEESQAEEGTDKTESQTKSGEPPESSKEAKE